MLTDADGVTIWPASFRDPAGRIFTKENILYRSVSFSYKEHYSHLMQSGLYSKLTSSGLLIHHDEVDVTPHTDQYKILKPSRIKFISYPYEWSFSQLKDAALLMLDIQKTALAHGMTLKDSSAFNIQFDKGKPVLIDTLSFEIYKEGEPWIAYKQFCQHFIAPLALMSYKDVRLAELFKSNLDGIPLDLTSSLLPLKSRFNGGILMHIHLHAISQKTFANKKINAGGRNKKFSQNAFNALVESLKNTIAGLRSPTYTSRWQNYYNDIGLPAEYIKEKIKTVNTYCENINPHFVLDIGANTGTFSDLRALQNSFVLALDNSTACIEKIYSDCKKNNKTNILPLVADIMNPSPSLGWENKERDALFKRGNADLVLALALVHHLAITNNLSLDKIADFFSGLAKHLIIEFVPKEDSNAQKLFNSKADIFPHYTLENFEKQFSNYFMIKEKTKLQGTNRVVYLMQRM